MLFITATHFGAPSLGGCRFSSWYSYTYPLCSSVCVCVCETERVFLILTIKLNMNISPSYSLCNEHACINAHSGPLQLCFHSICVCFLYLPPSDESVKCFIPLMRAPESTSRDHFASTKYAYVWACLCVTVEEVMEGVAPWTTERLRSLTVWTNQPASTMPPGS